MNARSPCDRRAAARSGQTTSRAHDESEEDRQHEAAPPEPLLGDEREIDRQAERDERGQLTEVGQGAVERPHGAPRGVAQVAHEDSRHEDGEEARIRGGRRRARRRRPRR